MAAAAATEYRWHLWAANGCQDHLGQYAYFSNKKIKLSLFDDQILKCCSNILSSSAEAFANKSATGSIGPTIVEQLMNDSKKLQQWLDNIDVQLDNLDADDKHFVNVRKAFNAFANGFVMKYVHRRT